MNNMLRNLLVVSLLLFWVDVDQSTASLNDSSYVAIQSTERPSRADKLTRTTQVTTEKTYGDEKFELGPETTPDGSEIIYTAENEDVLIISENTAIIQNAGTTKVTATLQNGESTDSAVPEEQIITVTRAELTISAGENQSKIYGDEDPEFEYAASGFVYDESADILSGSPGREPGEDAGNYAITSGDLDAGENYEVIFESAVFEIRPRELYIQSEPEHTKIYGDEDPGFDYQATGFVLNDDESIISGEPGRQPGEDVGNYLMNEGSLSAGQNYSVSFSPEIFTITPRTLNISAYEDQSKVYGEPDPDFEFQAAGFALQDNEQIISGSLSRPVDEDTGVYEIEVGDLSAGINYTIEFEPAEFEITPRTIYITADSDQHKIYGEEDPELTFSVRNLGPTDDKSIISGQLSRDTGENTGSYEVSRGDLEVNKNYRIRYRSAEFEIKARELVVAAESGQSKTYGEIDPDLTFTTEGFADGDSQELLTGSLTREPGEDTGKYKIGRGDLSAGENYQVTFQSKSFSIKPKELTVEADRGQSKIYGEEDPVLTYEVSGFEWNDGPELISGKLTREPGENSGYYEILAGDLGAGDNYKINFESEYFDILRRTLKVEAKRDQKKTYGEVDPLLEYTVTNFAFDDNEDVITGSLSRSSGEDVRNYIIKDGNLDAGKNYTIDYSSSEFEILPRKLKVKAASGQSKTYGEEDPELEYEISNFAFNDDESDVSGSLTREVGEDAGKYEIQATDLTAGDNYEIDFKKEKFKISPRSLKVVAEADQKKVYGDNDPENLSYSAYNFAPGEDEQILRGSLARKPGEDAGNYKISTGDLSAGDNYAIDYRSSDFAINSASLEIIIKEKTKVYGEADPDYEWTVSGFKRNDDRQILKGKVEREPGEDVDTYQITKGTLEAGENYTIDARPADFTIIPKQLYITVDNDQWKYEGDEDPEFTYSAEGFSFDDSYSVIKRSPARESGEQPGEYNIVQGNLDAGENYEIEFEGAEFSILRKPPKVSRKSPLNDETRIETDTPVIVEFDQEITLSDAELITVKGQDGNAADIDIKIDDHVLRLAHSDFVNHTTYTVTIGKGAVENSDDTPNNETQWSFTTIMPPPLGENPTPTEGDVGIGFTQPLKLSFSQKVDAADLSKISIRKIDNDSQIDVEAVLEDNRLIIDHEDFEQFTEYQVLIPRQTVKNEDEVGNEPYSWSFTSIWALPEEVVLAAPLHRQGSVELQPELEWKPADHAESYHIQISETNSFDEILFEQKNITGLAHEVAEKLEDFHLYHWRVRAKNSTGTSGWSDSYKFSTLADSPDILFPGDNSDQISIAPLLEWTSGYESTFRIQLSETENFEPLVKDDLTDQPLLQLTGLKDNQQYFWRVRVENEETTSEWTETAKFRTRPDPQNEVATVVRQNIEFGSTAEPGSRLMSLPGDDQHKLEEVLEGQYGKDWQAFIETGTETDEYKPEDERFTFSPGRGFWISAKDTLDLDLDITNVETNERDAYSIPLQPGWNIISNPHHGKVSWNDVQEMNEIQGELFKYERRFIPADSLRPVEGYYYYNDPENSLVKLDVPYSGMNLRRSAERSPFSSMSMKISDQSFVKIQADFTDEGLFTTELIYPSREQAEPGTTSDTGKIKRHHPSLEKSRFGMMLTENERETGGGLLRKADYYDGQGSEHELQLKGEIGTTIKLNAQLQNMPEQARVLLVNPVNGQSWLLTDGQEAETALTEQNPTYELYIGDKYWLNQKQQDLIPQEFILAANYPNPFNPVTNIRYSLPEKQHVKLEVYDVLGRRVQVLENNVQQPGWHVVQFDASSLSSGVYLYRLTTENDVSVRKMTLVK